MNMNDVMPNEQEAKNGKRALKAAKIIMTVGLVIAVLTVLGGIGAMAQSGQFADLLNAIFSACVTVLGAYITSSIFVTLANLADSNEAILSSVKELVELKKKEQN